jgi:hypothetical protein
MIIAGSEQEDVHAYYNTFLTKCTSHYISFALRSNPRGYLEKIAIDSICKYKRFPSKLPRWASNYGLYWIEGLW